RAADLPLDTVQGFVISRAALDELIDRLAALPRTERDRVPGIRSGRAEVILAGAVAVQVALELSGGAGIEAVEAGLREGILLAGALAPADPPLVPDVRAASVSNLARQHGTDLVHAEHVAHLVDQLIATLPDAGLAPPP